MGIVVDTVIVNYNSTDCAVRAIESIQCGAAHVRPNITVVDNGSSDRPQRIVERFPDVRLILSRRNLGYSKAINMALRQGRAEYAVIMNPDTLLVNGFFDDVVRFLSENKDIGIVGPKVFDKDGSVQGSARRFPTAWSYAFGRKSPITRLFPGNRLTQKEFMCFDWHGNRERDVDWVSGACMVIRREAFDAVNGFDEQFFLYWEDTDLCKRIKEAGWRIVYYPKAELTHIIGMSSNTKPVRSICHFHHSCYKLVVKHATGKLRLAIPLAFWALALRCGFAILLNMFGRRANKWKKRVFTKRAPAVCAVGSESKVKVLRILSRMNIGGPSIHVAMLTRKLNRTRFDSRLVIGSISKTEGDMRYLLGSRCNGQVYSIPELQREIHLAKDLVVFFRLLRIIRQERPLIVHTHTAKAGTVGRLVASFYKRMTGRPVALVHTFHGNVLEGYFSPLKSKLFEGIERLMARATDVIIAISPTQKADLVENHAIADAQKVRVINLGFDLSRFVNPVRRKNGALRTAWGLDERAILVGIVGRLVPIKNHRMFLDAARLFVMQKPSVPVAFVVVGDGELRRDLEEDARRMGISERIRFVGWEKDIQRVYAELDILALTSINEGTPVSIIEAMASGVPVITTEVGGVKDLLGEPDAAVQKNPNGFKVCRRGIMCPNNNAAAFASGLQFLVENEVPGPSGRIADAREYVLANYSLDRLVREIEALYESLLHPTGSRQMSLPPGWVEASRTIPGIP